MKKADLETPALLVDLPAMESNLQRMAEFFRHSPAKLRPHFKNHKCLALAQRQLEAGAIGMACATVDEAESLVRHGVSSVLIANEIASPAKMERVARLRRQSDVIVCVDSEGVADTMSVVAERCGQELHVLVDVDVGLHRCGVQPGEPTLKLAQHVIAKGLNFRGLMGYQGHGPHHPPTPETQSALRQTLRALIETRDCLQRAGIPVEIVSSGGTGNYATVGMHAGVTEVQAGSYLFMDTDYRESCVDFDLSLTVLATVVSKDSDRVVLDVGVKALSSERGLPTLKGIEGVTVRKLNAEHAILAFESPAAACRPGARIELWVPYADATVNLHDRVYGIRGDQVEEEFRIERGGIPTPLAL